MEHSGPRSTTNTSLAQGNVFKVGSSKNLHENTTDSLKAGSGALAWGLGQQGCGEDWESAVTASSPKSWTLITSEKTSLGMAQDVGQTATCLTELIPRTLLLTQQRHFLP